MDDRAETWTGSSLRHLLESQHQPLATLGC